MPTAPSGAAPASYLGGPRGIVESVAPSTAFLVAVVAQAPVRVAAAVAVGVALLLVLVRAVTRAPLAPAVSGAVLVVLCALVALRSGQARGFYAVGLVLNAGYALVLAASTLPLPRWRGSSGGPVPLVGVVVALARQAGGAWRADPAARRLALRLTWLWVGLFVLRLAVEVPLYAAGATTALGAARLVLNLPPYALLVWVTWAATRGVPAFSARPGPSGPLDDPAP